jgi:hypothetical protein
MLYITLDYNKSWDKFNFMYIARVIHQNLIFLTTLSTNKIMYAHEQVCDLIIHSITTFCLKHGQIVSSIHLIR